MKDEHIIWDSYDVAMEDRHKDLEGNYDFYAALAWSEPSCHDGIDYKYKDYESLSRRWCGNITMLIGK